MNLMLHQRMYDGYPMFGKKKPLPSGRQANGLAENPPFSLMMFHQHFN